MENSTPNAQTGMFKIRLGDLGDVEPVKPAASLEGMADILEEVKKPEDTVPTASEPPEQEVPTVESTTPEPKKESKVESSISKPENTSTNKYYELYQYLVSIGEIPEYETVTLEEGEVPIEEYMVTKEAFDTLYKAAKETKKEKELEGKIDIQELPPIYKDIIETIVAGGDVNAALQAYSVANDVVTQIDLSTEEGLQMAVVAYYRRKGIPDNAIIAMIKGYIAEGRLESEGRECYEKLNKENEEQAEAQRQAAVQQKQEYESKLKKTKSDMRNVLRESGLSDSKARVLVEKYMAVSQSGFFADTVYAQRLDDPTYGAELIFFLDNKDEYIKAKSAELINQSKLDVVKGVISGTENGGTKSIKLGMAKAQNYRTPAPDHQQSTPQQPQQNQSDNTNNSKTIKVNINEL